MPVLLPQIPLSKFTFDIGRACPHPSQTLNCNYQGSHMQPPPLCTLALMESHQSPGLDAVPAQGHLSTVTHETFTCCCSEGSSWLASRMQMLPPVVTAALGRADERASPANSLEHMAECTAAKRYPMMSHDAAQRGKRLKKNFRINTNGLCLVLWKPRRILLRQVRDGETLLLPS